MTLLNFIPVIILLLMSSFIIGLALDTLMMGGTKYNKIKDKLIMILLKTGMVRMVMKNDKKENR